MKLRIMFFVLVFILINITFLTVNRKLSYCNTYHSTSLPDTTKPVITHIPINFCPRYGWPALVSTVVSDSSGIDSVWVKWYKNNPSTMNREFRLNNTSGNNYSQRFNSYFSDVYYDDIIYYRIFAQDNSANHNRDSTPIYNILITSASVCQVGTGTDSSKFPFSTYWMDCRSQMLFNSTDISACGTHNGNITGIGFKVFSVAPQIMNGFNIRFQTTTQTSLTGFVNSGWQTVYSGTYAVQDTGWQFINFQNPNFWYQQNTNLLVEICFHNTSYTEYSYVYATQAIGMTWGYYMDNIPGCTMTGGSMQTKRPNIIFFINPIVGANGNSNNIPDKYILYQNYPNPFNPVTKINYNIPKNGFVSLRVYDMLGREIRTLVNEEKPAGSYSVDFNATEFSTGVYFYKLESKEFTDVKRMLLIK
ncbi:MAG: T9SS type A sorting domain-containing protein [Ignavibacteriota bacterium]